MIRRISFDHVLLVTAGIAGAVGLWAFISPANAPVTLDGLHSVVNGIPTTAIGVVIALLVLSVMGVRALSGVTDDLDRSPITAETPEHPAETPVPEASGLLQTTHDGVMHWFESPGETERHVAMYGRRAEREEDLPENIDQFLDELAVTARDTYATANSCDAETAQELIDSGEWTNDRVAAAFLASNGTDNEAATFTAVERATAWLAPKQTFERRVDRTVQAIEATADVYLTYDRPEQTGEEQAMHDGGIDA